MTSLAQASMHELTPSDLFGDLRTLKVKVHVPLERAVNAGVFLGSSWRGLVGTELKRICCPAEGEMPCDRCRARGRCPYCQLFETNSGLPGLFEVPRGYILFPPPSDGSARQDLVLTLLGRCARHFSTMAAALLRGQRTGLGADRLRYRILTMEELQPEGPPAPILLSASALSRPRSGHSLREWLAADCVNGSGGHSARLVTPVRLRRHGTYLTAMDWPFFFESLARRIEAIWRVHSGGEPLGRELWTKFVERLAQADGFNSRLRWHDYHRYSNRQKTKVPMGGLVGEVDLGESPPAWLLEWWKAAALVHVGKGACMGLGRVELV